MPFRSSPRKMDQLGFFTKKLGSAESEYGAYDREIRTMHPVKKHFRHVVGAKEFSIFTEHKSQTSAFNKEKKRLPRLFCHLDYINRGSIMLLWTYYHGLRSWNQLYQSV